MWFLYWSWHSVITRHTLFSYGALLVLYWSHLASVTPLLLPPKAVQRWDHFVPPSCNGDVYIEGKTLQRRKYRRMKWQYKKALGFIVSNATSSDSVLLLSFIHVKPFSHLVLNKDKILLRLSSLMPGGFWLSSACISIGATDHVTSPLDYTLCLDSFFRFLLLQNSVENRNTTDNLWAFKAAGSQIDSEWQGPYEGAQRGRNQWQYKQATVSLLVLFAAQNENLLAVVRGCLYSAKLM